LAISAVWLLGLPGDWLLDDFSLLDSHFPSLLRPRPLTYLTFWLNHELFGPAPWAYRLTNILIHTIGVQFCYRALRRLVGDERALFAAAVFAVHPLQADAVLYVFSRPVVLMGSLLWVSLDRWLAGRHWWAVGFHALALLAKEEAIAFPLVVAALHFSISRNAREWRPIGVMLALSIATVAGVAMTAQMVAGSGAGSQAGVGAFAYLATQPYVLALYLKQVLWPQFMGMRWAIELMPQWVAALWLVPVAGLWLARRHLERAGWAFWLLAALLVLLPTSSVFPIADLAAARRMYLPVALLAVALPAKRWLWILALVYAGISANWASTIYRQPEAMWRATMEAQPGRIEPVLQYVKFLPPAEALRLLESNARPQLASYQTELGRVYLEMHQPAEALRAFGRALALDPAVASHVYNRGVALAALGQQDAAEMDFRRALEIDPEHKPAKAALSILRK
jgi:tetratricopeptide (TPR) repeat protein